MRHMLAEWSIVCRNLDRFIMRALVSWSLMMRMGEVKGGEALVTTEEEKRLLV